METVIDLPRTDEVLKAKAGQSVDPEIIREHLRAILEYIGEDPNREGLLDTPDRIMRSWSELYAGYDQDPSEILKTVFSETEGYDQIVLLRDIPFFSNCEHHQQPYYGVAHIGYLVENQVVGVSKLARLLDCYARRMQIQERLTKSVARELMKGLNAPGVGVVVIGTHLCMTSRGVKKSGATLVSAAMEGVFKRNVDGIKDEFYCLVNI